MHHTYFRYNVVRLNEASGAFLMLLYDSSWISYPTNLFQPSLEIQLINLNTSM